MKKVNFFMNVAPLYRAPIWSLLLNHPDWDTHFYFGTPINNLQEIDFKSDSFSSNQHRLHRVKNYWSKDNRIIWQSDVIRECYKSKFDYAIFTSEMSRLSTWIAASICRLRGITVVFWAHGLYGHEKGWKLWLKKIFFRLPNKFLMYEKRGKNILVEHGFDPDNLHIVFNSLDYDTHKLLNQRFKGLDKNDVFPFFKNPSLPVIVFVGRVTLEKKIDMLLSAANQINHQVTKINLLIIGDGPGRKKLHELEQEGLQRNYLHFTGACYDEETIGKYLSMADLCVSPGNVGLTAIHSMSFGTPVSTHDNMCNQGPEAGTIIDGYNGFFFKENDIDDLKNKIVNWIDHSDRDQVRERSYEVVEKYYNPYYQLAVFERLFSGLKPEI